MKTRERLLFMALGGLLVLAGMIVGQFMFSPVQAQAGAQDATFKTVWCERLIVGDSLNRQAVVVDSFEGVGHVSTFNKAGKVITSLSATISGNGTISTSNNKGKRLTVLSSTDSDAGAIETYNSNTGKSLVSLTSDTVSGASSGIINVHNIHGVSVATLQGNKYNDGMILLMDRYGDLGWGKSGKQ